MTAPIGTPSIAADGDVCDGCEDAMRTGEQVQVRDGRVYCSRCVEGIEAARRKAGRSLEGSP